MRTTIDLPESLMARVRTWMAERNVTFRSLVISALEQALQQNTEPFHLRDASVGDSQKTVSNQTINRAIDEQREPPSGK